MPELYLQPIKPESLKNRSQALGGAGIENTAEETLLLAEALKWTNMLALLYHYLSEPPFSCPQDGVLILTSQCCYEN